MRFKNTVISMFRHRNWSLSQEKRKKVANRLEQGADLLTKFRGEMGTPIGAVTMLDKHVQDTWDFSLMVGVICATDKLDGWVARMAAWVRHGKTRASGGTDDERADKKWYKGTTIGSFGNALRRRTYGLAGVIAVSGAVNVARDGIVTRKRDQAIYLNDEYQLTDTEDQIKTSATQLGGYKTLCNMLALGASVSPLAKTHTGRQLTGGLFATGAALSVISGVSTVNMIENNVRNLEFRGIIPSGSLRAAAHQLALNADENSV